MLDLSSPAPLFFASPLLPFALPFASPLLPFALPLLPFALPFALAFALPVSQEEELDFTDLLLLVPPLPLLLPPLLPLPLPPSLPLPVSQEGELVGLDESGSLGLFEGAGVGRGGIVGGSSLEQRQKDGSSRSAKQSLNSYRVRCR